MKLIRKLKSKFYWCDFTIHGHRYRGSRQETKAVKAWKVAGLRLAQLVEGADPLPSKLFGVMGRSPVWPHPSGNNRWVGLRFKPRQYSRKAANSFGLSMKSRSLRPLPPWTWMTMR